MKNVSSLTLTLSLNENITTESHSNFPYMQLGTSGGFGLTRRNFLTAIKNGDIKTANSLLNNLYAETIHEIINDFEQNEKPVSQHAAELITSHLIGREYPDINIGF